MDKKDLQKKLNKPYSTDNWREVVQFVFPNVQILNPPMVIPIDNDKVETFRQLGNVQLHDGKSLALFELKLKANVNIIRNRVELNNIVSQYIDQDQTHGVLSIFEQGGDDYRFTFSARGSEFDEEEGDFKTTKTDTKRFTYVLGKNESCKTPAQRFYELSENKNKADIAAIENAFSVEKLSKAFFKEYKDQYTAFVNYMMQTPGIFKAIYSEDDKAIRDFVKILLGRIIFIKFVQKKGWMGVDAASKKWIDGDYRFLENGFANFKHQDLFYSTFLEPLFDSLDEPNRPNDIFTVTNTRVPYLSGGLFELEDKKTKNINFPANYFAGLFEFLDRYNFTIDENDTNDHEVGIDPEMLGHIFENLLEDNKDKGAFYTPKEIVRYMCQESLKEYLKTSLENHKQWPTDETEAAAFEQALHNFVTKKEAGGIIEFEETIARALKDVKICDPAIGSGAFPMGLLNEIFQLVHKLHEANEDKVERVWELKGWQPNKVKQNIIQNSIYGVDIEKGAVDVARLRFWLSLIVDEPEPKALPHLDYKIVVGNSLVSKLDDTIIDIDWNLDETQHGLFGSELAQERAAILQNISDKQKAVFDPNSDEEKLSLEIRNLKIDLLCKQLELMINNQNIPKEPKIADYQNKTKAKFVQDQTKYFETVGWQQQITKLQKLKKQPETPLHFFDWKLDFPEIMNEQVTENIGFDIVIANPPYIKEYTNKNVFDGFRISKYYQGKMDLWYGFACKMIDILKPKGIECFIAQNNWITSAGASIFRNKVVTETEIKLFTDFGNFKIFETAGIQTMIYILKKTKPTQNYYLKYSLLTNDKINSNEIIKFLNFENRDINSKKFMFDFDTNKQINKSISFNDDSLTKILDKIESKSNFKLEDKEIIQGIVGAPDEAFIVKDSNINVFTKNELIYLKKYYTNATGTSSEYIFYLCEKNFKEDNLDNYKNIKQHFNDYVDILKDARIRYKTPNKKYFFLHRERKESFFEKGSKIICQIRSVKPCFLYTEDEYYVSRAANIIKSKNIDLLYLSKLFNSNLIYFYFKNRGATQGNILKFDKGPLSKIPIFKPEKKTIASLNKLNHNEIDNLVYKLYELTYDEVLVVEPEFSERMSREAYEGLKVS